MKSEKADAALPLAIARNFVAQHQRVAVVPLADDGTSVGINISGELTINVNASTIDRVEGGNHMLQRGLQALGSIGGGQIRCAVGIALRTAVEVVVVIKCLRQGKIARVNAAGIADYARRPVLYYVVWHY